MTRPFSGYQHLYPLTVTSEFDLFFENLNLLKNMRTESTRAFIFYLNISSWKPFPLVPTFFTLYNWPWNFKNFNLANNIWTVSARDILHEYSFWQDLFYRCQDTGIYLCDFDNLRNWRLSEGSLRFINTSTFIYFMKKNSSKSSLNLSTKHWSEINFQCSKYKYTFN